MNSIPFVITIDYVDRHGRLNVRQIKHTGTVLTVWTHVREIFTVLLKLEHAQTITGVVVTQVRK